jgi:SPASM domain peptide maturase of grasp-with-spasm system
MKSDVRPFFFRLFSCCILVEGATRCGVFDVQRSQFILINRVQFELLSELNQYSVNDIKKNNDESSFLNILEFISDLENNEYGFYTNSPEFFPALNLCFDFPSVITNAIIDLIKIDNEEQIKKYIQGLEKLGCYAIQFRLFFSAKMEEVEFLLRIASQSQVKTIEVILKFTSEVKEVESIQKIIDHNLKVSSFIIYSSPFRKIINFRLFPIFYTTESIVSNKSCGIISQDNFCLNTKSFSEAFTFNSCLNRKIAIDIEGNIKNCPSMKESFGNIRDTTLQEALEKPGFKKYWNITKDQIQTCKDCEFRYICTDCRAYLEAPEDIYSKPLKCGYNPYTCEWEEWSTNPLKQKAIAHYGMESLKADAGPPEAQ